MQPSLPGLQLVAPERPLILPTGASPLESFATVVQQLLANDLEVRTDYVNAIAGPQLIQLQLRPHDLKKIKQLQGDAMSDSIQTLLSLPTPPIVTLDRGAIALSIPRPDRQFCHFPDYIQPASGGPRANAHVFLQFAGGGRNLSQNLGEILVIPTRFQPFSPCATFSRLFLS